MRTLLFSLFLLFSICFSYAQIVDIPDANLKANLLAANSSNTIAKNINGEYFDIDTNDDNEIQFSEASLVSELSLTSFGIVTSVEGLEGFISLIGLTMSGIYMSGDLSIQNLTNLEKLHIFNFDTPSFSLIDLPNFKDLALGSNSNENFNTLNFDSCNCPGLESININQNLYISDIDLSLLNNLKNFSIYANFSMIDLDISNNINLETFSLYSTGINELDFSQHPNLQDLGVHAQGLISLDISENLNLTRLDLEGGSNFESLDLSNHSNLTHLTIYDAAISNINIKNGNTPENLFISGSNIDYICADDNEIVLLEDMYLPYAVINSYCSFNPGGDYYTVEGENKVDANQNGCDTNDYSYPSLKFNITDGTNTGTYISDPSGNYSIPVSEGSHTFTPILENPDYFNAPSPVTVSFPQELSPYSQNFCVTPNGIHNDLEVFIVPITDAIPGFDSEYRILYRNTGNTILSGNVTFNYTFDNDYMEYIGSIPSETSVANNILSWDYMDLAPFETREILTTFTLNTPTDSNFPLNSGDELNFEAAIYPLQNDETPNNNDFGLKQIVVNSFDPNDIRCLEGETVDPERVGEFVHYLIRFENLGTANATNIVVKNNIDDTKFDINTLVPLYGSHDYYTRINAQNDVEFIFENINLSFDNATNDGYVLYKIKTLETLVLGDTFSNQAEIYFDFNAPVITNTYTTEISEDNLSVLEPNLIETRIYPNPVNDVLTIESEVVIDSASIYDINGREILVSKFEDINYQMDLDELKSGIYFLKLFSKTGSDTLKIIKK